MEVLGIYNKTENVGKKAPPFKIRCNWIFLLKKTWKVKLCTAVIVAVY